MTDGPELGAAEQAAIEEKLVTNGLAKLNMGQTPNRIEMAAIERAKERGATVAESATLELVPSGGEQLELGFPAMVIEKMESQGRWPDLTRLRARRPDIMQAAVWMLGHDVPIRDVCQALSLSPCTVQAIVESPELNLSVVTQKQRLTARMRLALRLGIEHQVEQARNGKLAMFDLKMLSDIIRDTEGGTTQRVEATQSPEEMALLDWLHAARQDVSGMVSGAENPLPMAREVEGSDRVPDADPSSPKSLESPRTGESESPVFDV